MFKSDRHTPIDCDPLSMLCLLRRRKSSGVPLACWLNGVPQPASWAVTGSIEKGRALSALEVVGNPLFFESSTFGVGQPDCSEPESLADVRRTDARSAQIAGPDGISQFFQVRSYSGEPRPSSF
jgi:hypothetical protein